MKGTKSRLVRIGNSRGVRIPKPAIELAGLGDEVELRVRPGAITIVKAGSARAGWAEAARTLRARGEDRVMADAAPSRFDNEQWRW